MEHVTGERIGPGNDGDARVVQRLEQAKHGGECFTVSSLLLLWCFKRAAAHGPANLRRKARNDLFQSGSDRGRIATEETFECYHRGIEHGVMLFQKVDELTH